ncbi:glycyl-radical enzyme activating protein [bacterium]|nr:glycyl-radical enzyme activating protein [bacterium]
MTPRAQVFKISRFSVHDGPGIRTTVFLKGCRLRCVWCHNPESMKPGPELAFFKDRCIFCGACRLACPGQGHCFEAGRHFIERTVCLACGHCADACASGALEITGREMELKGILETALRDMDFYIESGGGVTVSGGEPLDQWEFTAGFFSALRERGVHTCLDTSGFGSRQSLEALLPVTDLFLYDIKAVDPEKHVALTGESNRIILQNLDFLMNQNACVELRCPLIPGLNDSDEDLAGLADLAGRYPELKGITLLPFHNAGNAKYDRYGIRNPMQDRHSAGLSDTDRWTGWFTAAGCNQVKIS